MAQRRDKKATQAEILQSAEHLFSLKGFAATSLAEIAAHANVTKSLIHHHFGTKEQLWRAIKNRHMEQYRTLQLAMLEEPTLDEKTLARSIQGYFQFLSDRPRLSRMLSWAILENLQQDDQVLAIDLIELGVEKIRIAQQQGSIRGDLEPIHVILVFLLAVDGWFINGDRLCAEGRGEAPPCAGAERPMSLCSSPKLGALEAGGFVRDLTEIVLHGVVPRPTS